MVATEGELREAALSGRGLYIAPSPSSQGTDSDDDHEAAGGGGGGDDDGGGGAAPRWAPSWGQRNPSGAVVQTEEADPTPALAVFLDAKRGDVYAIEDRCPHAGHRMSRGDVLQQDIEEIAPKCGLGIVVACPAHAFTYSLASGACLSNPASGGKAVRYAAKLEGGAVWVGGSLPASDVVHPVTKEQTDRIQLCLVGQALDRKYGPSS